MHLFSLDNSNYWQFHKTLEGKVVLLPITPFNEILERRVEFLLLRGMEGDNKCQLLVPTCSSFISGNSKAWDRLSTFKGDPNTQPLQPVRITGLDNSDFSQARKAYIFEATKKPAIGQDFGGLLFPAFSILAPQPPVWAMRNPVQSAGTDHHKLLLLWSGLPAPQPAAAGRRLQCQ